MQQMAEVGRRIRILRQSLGMKQQEFADYLGIPQATVSFIERGLRRIRPEMVIALSQKGYDANWITLGKEVDDGKYHLQRQADLQDIQQELEIMDDAAVHLTKKWIDLLVDFQKENGLLLIQKHAGTKERTDDAWKKK